MLWGLKHYVYKHSVVHKNYQKGSAEKSYFLRTVIVLSLREFLEA